MPTRLWRSRFRPRSLRTYLALFALALTLPLLTLAIFALNQMAETEQAQIERQVLRVAHELAIDIDREIDRAFITLETLSTSAALKGGNLREFHAQAVLALKPKKAAIVLLDRSHQQLVDTLKEFDAELPPTADPQTSQLVIDTKQRQVSNLFRGSISGRPVFNVESPVLDDEGAVRYVLVMSFQAAHIADLLTTADLGPTWIAGVTDNNGIILARSDRHEEFVGKPLPAGLLEQSRTAKGVFRTTNVAGDHIIRATVRSGLTGWLVSATVPTAQIDAPQRRGERFALLLLGTSLILGLVLAYVFASFMSQPLDAATQVAAAVGRDDAPVVGPSPLTEANVLIQTLQTASKELKQRQDHSDFLRRELAHRAKNQLAVVRGMALQTARESGNVADFVTKLNRRIQGLAGSQDVLVAQNWQGAWLDELVRAQLEVFGAGGRVRISGPALFLETTAVQNIGFALHELATNAAKYGCLANDAGHLEIEWNVGANEIVLLWKEIDGPPVAAPAHKGFGTRVIMELVPQTLQGSVVIHFWPAGLQWRLTIPNHYAVPFPTS